MKIFRQSPSLKEAFDKQIKSKKSVKRQEIRDQLGGGFWGLLVGASIFEANQLKNKAKGYIGENLTG
ncbi:MAG TPA: hypothetical protein ACFCUY_12645 [Xenococcaceae cyanobacterium]|jgi:hypothetical protein